MSDGTVGLIAVLIAIVIICLIFKGPITQLLNRSRSVDLEVSKDGLKANFRTDLETLERESSATAEALKASSPGPVELTGSQQALPAGDVQPADPTISETSVTVRDLLAIGADWSGLISEAKQLLEDNDLPTPRNQSSLGNLLQAFDDDLRGILPERAEGLAADADNLLQTLMAVGPGNVKHEDVRLFSSALASLHTIIIKAASKARHPSRSRGPKGQAGHEHD